jgi:hypothetical protein
MTVILISHYICNIYMNDTNAVHQVEYSLKERGKLKLIDSAGWSMWNVLLEATPPLINFLQIIVRCH